MWCTTFASSHFCEGKFWLTFNQYVNQKPWYFTCWSTHLEILLFSVGFAVRRRSCISKAELLFYSQNAESIVALCLLRSTSESRTTSRVGTTNDAAYFRLTRAKVFADFQSGLCRRRRGQRRCRCRLSTIQPTWARSSSGLWRTRWDRTRRCSDASWRTVTTEKNESSLLLGCWRSSPEENNETFIST